MTENMDTTMNSRVNKRTPHSVIFMQNKVFLDDVINVAEVRTK